VPGDVNLTLEIAAAIHDILAVRVVRLPFGENVDDDVGVQKDAHEAAG
jgi:hypothetical protein